MEKKPGFYWENSHHDEKREHPQFPKHFRHPGLPGDGSWEIAAQKIERQISQCCQESLERSKPLSLIWKENHVFTLYIGQTIKEEPVCVHSAATLSRTKRPMIVRVKTKVKTKVVTTHFLEHSHLVLPETNDISYQKKACNMVTRQKRAISLVTYSRNHHCPVVAGKSKPVTMSNQM